MKSYKILGYTIWLVHLERGLGETSCKMVCTFCIEFYFIVVHLSAQQWKESDTLPHHHLYGASFESKVIQCSHIIFTSPISYLTSDIISD